ncbi:MAG: 3-deoxy-D-manno-octulosonic acid transferase [Alphaproteobacteria bacterium]|nr:3-deoxy-D-manno-octulosonic acid transferase [Alphaproteobacteria bacterium]
MILDAAALSLYRLLSIAAAPIAPVVLQRRLARGKESADRLDERYGIAKLARPRAPLVWLHGASVGEALSALPLMEAMRRERDDLAVLLTTGTVTSSQLMAERLPPYAIHQFVPVDSLPFVRRFIAHWKPDLALWLESELWPNLLTETAARGVPLLLVNARMSARSHRGWARARSLSRRLLKNFTGVIAQDEASAARLSDLGAEAVAVSGSLKTAAEPLPADDKALAALQSAIGARPVLLAASTHAGEDEIVLEAHRIIARTIPDLLTIIVPRHPERGEAVATLAEGVGLASARRSACALPLEKTQTYVADTLGELGLFYRLADLAFIGGSLVAHGGQNPYEPARLACPILHGPHVMNFEPAYRALVAAKGSGEVASAEGLASAAARLLGDPAARSQMAERAAQALARDDALERTLQILRPFLAQLPIDARA